MSRAEDIFAKIEKDGEKAIDDFILTQQSEEMFLDFKRSADQGNGTILHINDRNNLGKAISGFGNSEGGVIVWGIECKRGIDGADLPKAKFPITNVKRFVSLLENAVSGCTIPPHPGVKSHAIVAKNGNGFVATYIPKSELTPHQDINEKRYYMRAGSNFVPVSHDLLAGLFGKRPQPKVFNMFTYSPLKIVGNSLKVSVGFMLRNAGKVVAKDVFVSIWVIASPGVNCLVGFQPAENDPNWQGYWSLQRNYSVISKPELRLPPASQLQPVVGEFIFTPPFTNKIKLEITSGCDGGIVYTGTVENSPENIQKAYDEVIKRASTETLTTKELQDYALKLMGRVEEID